MEVSYYYVEPPAVLYLVPIGKNLGGHQCRSGNSADEEVPGQEANKGPANS